MNLRILARRRAQARHRLLEDEMTPLLRLAADFAAFIFVAAVLLAIFSAGIAAYGLFTAN
jgi:uncharacterized membrane protein (DUF106 family)